MTVALDYLIFDYSEDDEGTATWDAMASVQPSHAAALLDEVQRVLQWADTLFPRQRGPVEEGGSWDFDLSASSELQGVLPAEYDASLGRVQLPALQEGDRLTLTLTISGRSAFADAFARTFEQE